jgi:hypothetical protein
MNLLLVHRCTLLLCHVQTADGDIRVVSGANSVDAVSGLELSCDYQRRLIVARDDDAVDRALDAIALNRDGDLLSDGLSWAIRLVHSLCTAAFASPRLPFI